MKCNTCGFDNLEGNEVCISCGGNPNAPPRKLCQECGRAMSPDYRNCPVCGWRPGMSVGPTNSVQADAGLRKPVVWLSLAAILVGVNFLYWGAWDTWDLTDSWFRNIVDAWFYVNLALEYISGIALLVAGYLSLKWCYRPGGNSKPVKPVKPVKIVR